MEDDRTSRDETLTEAGGCHTLSSTRQRFKRYKVQKESVLVNKQCLPQTQKLSAMAEWDTTDQIIMSRLLQMQTTKRTATVKLFLVGVMTVIGRRRLDLKESFSRSHVKENGRHEKNTY